MQIGKILKENNAFLKYKCQDVYTDQWTLLIFDIFCMYKTTSVKLWGPLSSEAPVQVNHLNHS